MLVSCSAYSSTLKMQTKSYSETSVDFQWTTRRYIPQDNTPPGGRMLDVHVQFLIRSLAVPCLHIRFSEKVAP
jgi:hypothetical protein